MKKQPGPAKPTIEILEKSIEFQGFFQMEKYRLRHRLFDGRMSPELDRELFERGHAAAVLPYDPVRDEVVLIEQFRIGALEARGGAWLIEIIAGIIEEGESAEEVIRREAIEEAGCTLREIEPICDYLVSPGGTSESLSLYCGIIDATGIGGVHGLIDEGEDIRVEAVPFDIAWEWVEQGIINSASPIIALQWLASHRERIRNRA